MSLPNNSWNTKCTELKRKENLARHAAENLNLDNKISIADFFKILEDTEYSLTPNKLKELVLNIDEKYSHDMKIVNILNRLDNLCKIIENKLTVHNYNLQCQCQCDDGTFSIRVNDKQLDKKYYDQMIEINYTNDSQNIKIIEYVNNVAQSDYEKNINIKGLTFNQIVNVIYDEICILIKKRFDYYNYYNEQYNTQCSVQVENKFEEICKLLEYRCDERCYGIQYDTSINTMIIGFSSHFVNSKCPGKLINIIYQKDENNFQITDNHRTINVNVKNFNMDNIIDALYSSIVSYI